MTGTVRMARWPRVELVPGDFDAVIAPDGRGLVTITVEWRGELILTATPVRRPWPQYAVAWWADDRFVDAAVFHGMDEALAAAADRRGLVVVLERTALVAPGAGGGDG